MKPGVNRNHTGKQRRKRDSKTMGTARSRRLRLLESLRRTISDKLHEKVNTSNGANGGFSPPENTSAIYTQAKHVAPDLLDQLFNVHQRACEEQGQPMITGQGPEPSDIERKQMLSAVGPRSCGRRRGSGRPATRNPTNSPHRRRCHPATWRG